MTHSGRFRWLTLLPILGAAPAAFRDSPETTSSTYLAYQFFGHPGRRLQ